MRVADATFIRQFLAGLAASRRQSADALLSLADGKKVRAGSDDPAGAHASMALRARLARLEGFERSASSGRADLATLDRVLGEVVNLLTEVRSEAMHGASFPDDVSNEVLAQMIEDRRDQLLQLANTSQNGRYLLGGTETLTTPFANDGTYAGNDNEVQTPIDSGEQVGGTLSGGRVFLDGGDLFTVLDDLAQAFRDNRTDDAANLLPALKNGLDHVIVVRGDVGHRLQVIDAIGERHADESVEVIGRIAEIEDVDLERLIVELQASMTATEALSATAARVLGRSLFDYLG